MRLPAKKLLKRSLVKLFHLGQRLGVDILPRHFYSEIPVVSELRATTAWRRPYSLIGVTGADPDAQLEFVNQTVTPAIKSHLRQRDVYGDACVANGAAGYGPIEAQMLFAFVAAHKPARIVQIGCGVSTALCIAAADFAGYKPHITCIEPYPTKYLLSAESRGELELTRDLVQNIGLDFFTHLGVGDLFFVDSTHTLGPAGEVTRIILEMLPRLKKGVHVHFHDIVFPYDYAPGILSDGLFFWHESPLLHAFLCMNPSYRIDASLAYLHHYRQAELAAAFEGYQPMAMKDGLGTGGHFPSSIFLRVTGSDTASTQISASSTRVPTPLPARGASSPPPTAP